MKHFCFLFSLYEKDSMYAYKKGIQTLLNNAILDEVDYYIVINGETTVDIPERENVVLLRRENKGFDFGAWSYALKNLRHRHYLYYFFANSSVTGPYLKNGLTKWYQPFIECFGPEVHLVGTGMDTQYIGLYYKFTHLKEIYKTMFGDKRIYSYISSMFFALDQSGLSFLESINFFDEDECNGYKDLLDVIVHKEVAMSQKMLNHGYNINCLIKPYRGLDYRTCQVNMNTFDFGPANAGCYFTGNVSPEDVVFFKFNRYGFVPRI